MAGKGAEGIVTLIPEEEVAFEGTVIDLDRRLPDSATRGTRTDVTATSREVGVVEDAIAGAEPGDGLVAARLQPQTPLDRLPAAVAAAHLATVLGPAVVAVKAGGSPLQDEETSGRDRGRGRDRGMRTDLGNVVIAETTEDGVLGLVDRVPHPQSAHLPRKEGGTPRHEADLSIAVDDIREASHHPGLDLPTTLEVAVEAHLDEGAEDQRVDETVLQTQRAMIEGGRPVLVAVGNVRQGDASLREADDGTVPQLRLSPEPGANQLIFLKMNPARRLRLNPTKRKPETTNRWVAGDCYSGLVCTAVEPILDMLSTMARH